MIANYRITRPRSVVENAFTIFSSRFKVFKDALQLHPETVREIV